MNNDPDRTNDRLHTDIHNDHCNDQRRNVFHTPVAKRMGPGGFFEPTKVQPMERADDMRSVRLLIPSRLIAFDLKTRPTMILEADSSRFMMIPAILYFIMILFLFFLSIGFSADPCSAAVLWSNKYETDSDLLQEGICFLQVSYKFLIIQVT